MPPLVLIIKNVNKHMQLFIYSASQVAKITDLTPSQVAQIGQFIVPHIPANGKGFRIGYSFRNIVEVLVVSHLIKFGVPRKRIQKYLSDLVGSRFGWLEEDGHNGWIVLDDGWRWGAGTTPNDALEVLKSNQAVYAAITLDMGLIKERIRNKIKEVEEAEYGRRTNPRANDAEGSIALS